MTDTLSAAQARKLVLHSQQLPPAKCKTPTLEVTQQALEQLNYVQIDTISVIQRAHHHTLWSRNPHYNPEQLDQLIANKTAFEYWSHAAAFLPMRDYRFSLPRKHDLKTGKQKHWYERDTRLMKYVQDRIQAEGPLMARDFDSGEKTHEWHKKPAKRALEYLFMQGDLMVPERKNFHKVYELTERVLPAGVDDRLPGPEEYARFLISRFLKAQGLAQENDFSYLLKQVKPAIKTLIKQMLAEGELTAVKVGDKNYYALPDSLKLLNKPLAKRSLKILSPFDNMVIQRHRMRDLFEFDYLIECYVPQAKRKYGYFCLPILWDGRLVARMDCKAERKTGTLHIYSLHLEPFVKKVDEFTDALNRELPAFMAFNDCKTLNYSGQLAIDKQLRDH